MSETNKPESSGDAYDDVVNSLEEHYRALFNAAYADACSYAHVLKTLHALKRGVKQNREVAELERWFNGELQFGHGRERADGEPESDASTT